MPLRPTTPDTNAQSEAATRQLGSMQSAILDALPAHVALIDLHGVILAVNESWRRFATANVLPCSEAEAGVGQNYLQICERSQTEGSNEARTASLGIRRVLAGELKEFVCEYPCHSENEQRWFRQMVTPLNMDCGPGAVIMHINITDRKLAEETLRKVEEEQRTLIRDIDLEHTRLADAQHIAKIGSWETDPATLAVVWSEETYRIFETDPATFQPTHQSFLELVYPADRAKVDHAFQQSLNLRGIHTVEHRIALPDGRIKFVEERWQTFFNEAGLPFRSVGTCRDLTDQLLAEEKLHQQAAILDNAHDAIIVRDTAHLVTYWNKSAERLYGWTAAEATGRHLQELLRIAPREFAEAERIVHTTGVWNGEIAKTSKTGSTLTVEASWTLLRDAKGAPRSILTIDTDITERKKLEQQFLRAQRMESIGTLAGGIAHDLNNLLAPITMGVELLRLHSPDAKCRLVIDNIERSAKRGASLVKQVLSFARGVEGDRVHLQIRHIIGEIESITRDTFPKNISFESDLATDLWPVLGDPTQLNQVFLNLCVNARDALPHGGRLTLRAANIELDAHYAAMNSKVAAGRYVLVEVSDNGCGIPPDIIDHIFDPFFTTKEVGKGTGLGLSTVLGILRSHGGFVNVYSEPGKGTTFKVYLPALLDPATDGSNRPFENQIPRGKGELVLVVDDEATILAITQQTLESFGYRVLNAEDGAQAIALYAQHHAAIALVLTDMMMPVMDGPALIAALRRINPRVRIIAASGLNDNANIARATSARVNHFLSKPYSAEAILKMLRTVLEEPAPAPSASGK